MEIDRQAHVLTDVLCDARGRPVALPGDPPMFDLLGGYIALYGEPVEEVREGGGLVGYRFALEMDWSVVVLPDLSGEEA